jgi:hypothetical protein
MSVQPVTASFSSDCRRQASGSAGSWACRLLLGAVVLGLLLAPLSPAYAVRGRPEKKMAFQSTRVKARTDMKSEIRPKRGEEEGTEEQTEATAGSSGSY